MAQKTTLISNLKFVAIYFSCRNFQKKTHNEYNFKEAGIPFSCIDNI